ncbi:hypothetical protein QJS66_19560 [Kocuria rhizophila]|nr:hypothetical protein QJS66_19560 [Kocuria rhizophila]
MTETHLPAFAVTAPSRPAAGDRAVLRRIASAILALRAPRPRPRHQLRH